MYKLKEIWVVSQMSVCSKNQRRVDKLEIAKNRPQDRKVNAMSLRWQFGNRELFKLGSQKKSGLFLREINQYLECFSVVPEFLYLKWCLFHLCYKLREVKPCDCQP